LKLARRYNEWMLRLTFVCIFALLAQQVVAAQNNSSAAAPNLNDILERIAAHDAWQNGTLIEYQVRRTFHAANPRFNMESMLEVRTRFRRPRTFESEVLRSEGSELIREHVFAKILDAEKEVNTSNNKKEVDITQANYNFKLAGTEECGGRVCYRLGITPKQKTKYAIAGQIWVDGEDGAIVRIQGSPAKRPSFWTLSTEIERRYTKVHGVWLCEAMESKSNIFIGGPSTLKIDYNYAGVETERRSEPGS